ncbi:23S rRNA (uracil(1939)-C(5))-methyltransferase RlmD [Planomicrobium sp. CPCC 101079]|uniref:23S rRNA (uracil(1939)-C(5))-methyltransferase RlmD n=1 Tax=Planomicrobium sp. CPCC 101079 TaxID=2599618 RepID=UPI0011B649BB|nr:23S rRNA (uracil(1939)-C(5))-methyltransferase RlmD [Planomicrobium sp. CPCC 101079]TWT13443.1 23S rRNA (uracil(1939)-C(5))-methyltransferase RlmD [Planomicrobium sp. CPCC 101079]
MNEKPIFEEGQKFPLTIKRLGINGEGIGYFKRNVVFVQGALPGEEITAQVTSIKRNFAEARVLKLRKASPYRQTPPCPIYETCGGCQLQHMTYEQQLVEKRDLVTQALERYLKGTNVQIKNTIGMEDPWYYRNKSQFQTRLKGTKVIAGLFAEGSHQLLDIEQCIVQHPDTTVITNAVKRILEELKIPIYDGKTMKGIIRTIVVRTGVQTGEIQLVLITTRPKIPHKELLLEKLKQIDINLVSIVQNINKEKTSLIFGDETITLYGKDTIHEELGELAFDLSARAFFQLNPVQTVKLYDEIKRAAELSGKESVVDAYCGVGTIGLWLADSAGELRGMDVIHESVVDAKANAKKMGVTAKYVTGTAEKWLETWINEGFVPDVLTVDPPRTGLGESLLKTILKVKPKRFVYTSCNPSTLAKDLQQLTKIYRIEYIQPVDMFPQTAQVEAVTKLVLK